MNEDVDDLSGDEKIIGVQEHKFIKSVLYGTLIKDWKASGLFLLGRTEVVRAALCRDPDTGMSYMGSIMYQMPLQKWCQKWAYSSRPQQATEAACNAIQGERDTLSQLMPPMNTEMNLDFGRIIALIEKEAPHTLISYRESSHVQLADMRILRLLETKTAESLAPILWLPRHLWRAGGESKSVVTRFEKNVAFAMGYDAFDWMCAAIGRALVGGSGDGWKMRLFRVFVYAFPGSVRQQIAALLRALTFDDLKSRGSELGKVGSGDERWTLDGSRMERLVASPEAPMWTVSILPYELSEEYIAKYPWALHARVPPALANGLQGSSFDQDDEVPAVLQLCVQLYRSAAQDHAKINRRLLRSMPAYRMLMVPDRERARDRYRAHMGDAIFPKDVHWVIGEFLY